MKSAFTFLADRNFLPGLEVLINSMMYYNPSLINQEIDWIVISDELEGSMHVLNKEIKIIKPSKRYSSMHPNDNERYKKTFDKFTLFEDQFLEYEYVYFFDSDLLCTGSFSAIYPINIKNQCGDFDFFACADNGRFINRIFKQSGRVVINSGLFIFKPEKLKGSIDFLMKLIEKPSSDGGEQPLINELVWKKNLKFCQLHDGYNVLKRIYEKHISIFRGLQARGEMKFLHFVQKKPWNSYEDHNKEIWDMWTESQKKHKGYFQYE